VLKNPRHAPDFSPRVLDIEETITNPIKTLYLERMKVVYFKYFKHRKDPEKYLKVIVKYLNGEGFVMTAYFARTIK